MALGQVPLGLWMLAVPALAALMAQIVRASGLRQAAWTGLLGGAGYFALALNWIVEPFLVDAPRYGWMAPFALVLMAVGLALFWAGAAALARLSARPVAALVVSLTAVELARGYVLTGFPWALIGHVWIGTPVAQLAALAGPTGLTLLTCGAAALLSRLRLVSVVPGLALIALGWGYGLWVLSQPDPAPRGVMLRLVQPDADQEGKWDPDKAQLYLDRLLAFTSASPRVDLVIWPETALPYVMERDPELAQIIADAGGGASVAVGRQRVVGRQGWNTLTVYGPGGVEIASYDKHHLVPFGEYLPLGDLAYDLFGIAAFAAQTGHSYTAGPGPRLLDLGARLGRVLPLICYEAVFPQDLRGTVRPDWLLQVTNDAWFGKLSGPFQHEAQARLRAIEQGLPLVRVANTGVTEVVDARGRVTASLPFGTVASLDAALPGALPATPYSRAGETPVLLLLAGAAALAFRRRRARVA